MKKTAILFVSALLVAGAMTSCGSSSSKESGEATEQSEDSPEMKIFRAQLDQLNKQLPMPLEDGLKLNKVELDGKTLVYVCEYPSTLDFTAPDDAESKKTIMSGLPRATVQMLKKLGLSLRYEYIKAGTDEKQTIDISPEEF